MEGRREAEDGRKGVREGATCSYESRREGIERS